MNNEKRPRLSHANLVPVSFSPRLIRGIASNRFKGCPILSQVDGATYANLVPRIYLSQVDSRNRFEPVQGLPDLSQVDGATDPLCPILSQVDGATDPLPVDATAIAPLLTGLQISPWWVCGVVADRSKAARSSPRLTGAREASERGAAMARGVSD